jgi:hypothetical protein
LAEKHFSVEQAVDQILLAVNETILRFGNDRSKQRMVS